jgi:hypothetical protein
MSDFDADLKKLMQETVAEMGDYFKNFEEKFHKNQQRFETVQQKLYGHIEKECSSHVQWLQKNSNSANSSEFQNKLKEFENCASQNDFGFANFIQDLSKDQEAHAKSERKCILDCKADNKTDGDIKVCLKKCLTNSTNSFSLMYDRIDEKLNEVSKKL